MLVREIVEYGLSFRGIKLNAFSLSCGVTPDIVCAVIYSYLSHRSNKMKKLIISEFEIDITLLSWKVWHGCVLGMDHVIGKGIDLKKVTSRECTICTATRNVYRPMYPLTHEYIVTTTPEVHTRGRAPMHFGRDDVDVHYVIWSGCHNSGVNLNYINDVRNEFGQGVVFNHGVMTYSHDHIHVINGRYYDIRAHELFKLVILNLSCDPARKLESHDIFHPFPVFYRNCSSVGQDYIIAAFVLNAIPLNLSQLDDEAILLFLKLSYADTFSKVKMHLDNGSIGSDLLGISISLLRELS